MNLQITIKYVNGEPVTVTPRTRAFVAWEKETGKTVTDLATRVGMGDIAFLAWASLDNPQPFEEWLAEVEDVEATSVDPKAPKKAR